MAKKKKKTKHTAAQRRATGVVVDPSRDYFVQFPNGNKVRYSGRGLLAKLRVLDAATLKISPA